MSAFRDLEKRQQATILIVVAIGLLTMVFSFARIRQYVTVPFQTGSRGSFVSDEEKAEQAKLALKNKETDSDGISDYDEIYVYRTSPYLADSDSDGINDGDEIKSLSDPNCPKGKVCRDTAKDETANSTAPLASPGLTPTAPANAQPTSPSAEGPDFVDLLLTTFGDLSVMTAEQFSAKVKATPIVSLRTLLAKAGIPATNVATLSDESVRQAFDQIFVITQSQAATTKPAGGTNTNSNSTNSNTNTSTTTNSSTTPVTPPPTKATK